MKSSSNPPDKTVVVGVHQDDLTPEARPMYRSDWTRGDDLKYADYSPLRLKDYFSILVKRKKVAILLFLLIFCSATIYTFNITPIYRSNATLEIDKEGANSISNIGEAVAQSFSMNDTETFVTQAEILKSRFLAEALIEKMDLANSAEFTPQPGFLRRVFGRTAFWADTDGDKVSEAMTKDALISAVSRRISVRREKTSRLLTVSIESKDPEFGQKMLQEYLALYLERNLNKRRFVGREATSWLKDELRKSEDKLVDTMAALVKFTHENGMVSLDQGSNHVLTFFNKAAEGLVKSKENRVMIEAFKKEGEHLRGATIPMPAEAKTTEFSTLKEKLSIAETEYMQLREIYSEDYPKLLLLKKQIGFLKDKILEVENGAVSAAIETAKAQEQLQQVAFERAKKEAMDSNSLGVQFAILKKEVETNEQIFKLLLQKSKEMELNVQITGNNVSVIDTPNFPRTPVRPARSLYLMIGCLMGLAGGIAGAFLWEQMDSSIRSSEDLEKCLNLPTLGVVPNLQKFKKVHDMAGKKNYEFIVHESPKSPIAEAIRNIKTSILLSSPHGSMGVLAVTSAEPREGKSFLSVSIASVLCSGPRKTLIIDGDLRRPRIGSIFGKKVETPGLTSMLTQNDVKLQSVVHRSGIPGLYYMPSGPLPPNPVSLLESDRMAKLLNRLREIFDYIIIDSPPVIGFSDARILADMADAAILVVKEGLASADLVRQAKYMISTNRCRIIGAVLNMADRRSSFYGGRYSKYYWYYGYGYSHQKSDKTREITG